MDIVERLNNSTAHEPSDELANEIERLRKQSLLLQEALRAVALSKDHKDAVMFACNALDWHILPDDETP